MSSDNTFKKQEEENKYLQRVFKYDLLSEEKVLTMLKRLDQINENSIRLISSCSNYIETNIGQYFAKGASGMLKGNKTIARSQSKCADLCVRLIFCQRGGKDQLIQTLQEAEIPRVIYENLSITFSKTCQDYLALSEQAAVLHNRLLKKTAKAQKALPRYNKTLEKILHLEELLQITNRHTAYGVLKHLALLQETYQKHKDEIATPYLRLVYSMAARASYNRSHFNQFFQEGSIGLLKAISFFKVSSNAMFSSYAKIWIKKRLVKSVRENSFIRLPDSVWNDLNKISKDNHNKTPKFEKRAVLVKSLVHRTKSVSSLDSLSNSNQNEEDVEDQSQKGSGIPIENHLDRLLGACQENEGSEHSTLNEKVNTLYDYLSDMPKPERQLLCVTYGLTEHYELEQEEKLNEVLRQNLAALYLERKKKKKKKKHNNT